MNHKQKPIIKNIEPNKEEMLRKLSIYLNSIFRKDHFMPFDYDCPPENYLPHGIYVEEIDMKAFPQITKNVTISFDKKACLSANLNGLYREQLNMQLKNVLSVAEASPALASRFSGASDDNLRELLTNILANANHPGSLPLSQTTQKDFKTLFRNLECHVDLHFQFVKATTYISSKNYKIALCSTEEGSLQSMQKSAWAMMAPPRSVHPTECYIAFDPIEAKLYPTQKLGREAALNTHHHETMHALGADHPKYPNPTAQLNFRSTLEEPDTPLLQKCIKNNRDAKTIMTCYQQPTSFTAADLCALRALHGPSRNHSDYCQAQRRTLVAQYSILTAQPSNHEEALTKKSTIKTKASLKRPENDDFLVEVNDNRIVRER